jgi:hypothetical protein
MQSFVLFAVATIGLTNILVHGKILDEIKIFKKSIREILHIFPFLKELLSCYECTGWWSGLFMGFLTIILNNSSWGFIIIYPFAGSVLASFYSELIFFIRSKTDFVLNVEENEK